MIAAKYSIDAFKPAIDQKLQLLLFVPEHRGFGNQDVYDLPGYILRIKQFICASGNKSGLVWFKSNYRIYFALQKCVTML